MIAHPHIKLSRVIMGLSSALDLVNQFVVNHHRQVTGFAGKIADEMGLPDSEMSDLAIASALHDIGAVSFNERFEMTFNATGLQKHAELGYLLLKDFTPFRQAARMIRCHHIPWDHGNGSEYKGKPVPLGGHIIHLADRAAVLLDNRGHVLTQVDGVRDAILREKGNMFHPDVVDAFMRVSAREFFWLDSMYMEDGILDIKSGGVAWNEELDLGMLLKFSEMFRKIIDFRSTHTAAHSKSVAAVSEELARMTGFSEYECRMIRTAGNLHDLGKLAVPVEVLDKPGPLDKQERDIMKCHVYHTHRVLSTISGMDPVMEAVNAWASFHHECLDGTGYPFHHVGDVIPLGSRILAVADVFSALMQDRPYRPAMPRGDAHDLMSRMSSVRKLDRHLVGLVEREYDRLYNACRKAEASAHREFDDVRAEAAGTRAAGAA
ncbi:MAG: HD domain-containing protein [Nitrospirae bacterium]|nr:HD domain-containing protein [Nitrospirota bacterium]